MVLLARRGAYHCHHKERGDPVSREITNPELRNSGPNNCLCKEVVVTPKQELRGQALFLREGFLRSPSLWAAWGKKKARSPFGERAFVRLLLLKLLLRSA